VSKAAYSHAGRTENVTIRYASAPANFGHIRQGRFANVSSRKAANDVLEFSLKPELHAKFF
jgi:hypothetical protein